MTQEIENPPAFPRDHRYLGHDGMSLRDWFAGQVLPVAVQQVADMMSVKREDEPQWVAQRSYAIADAMLRARGDVK